MEKYFKKVSLEKFILERLESSQSRRLSNDAMDILMQLHLMDGEEVESVVHCKDCIFRDKKTGRCKGILKDKIVNGKWYCGNGKKE